MCIATINISNYVIRSNFLSAIESIFPLEHPPCYMKVCETKVILKKKIILVKKSSKSRKSQRSFRHFIFFY